RAYGQQHRGGRVSHMTTATLERSMVERLVRDALRHRLDGEGRPGGNGKLAAPKLVVNISARHCHVTQTDLERLFGVGHKLTPYKPLYQVGFFAAEETVTIIGPRHRMIPHHRILGPCLAHRQMELAYSISINMCRYSYD